MSEESPRFNEIFVQPSPTKITDYRFDLDRGDSDVRQFPEDIDRKLIGFESIDQLLSTLNQQHPKQEKERLPAKHVLQQPQKMPFAKKPTITINYSKPNPSLSPRNSPAPQSVFRPARSPQVRVRRVVQYEERMVRVPVQREIVEYGEIEELVEPSETRLNERPHGVGTKSLRWSQPPLPNIDPSPVTMQKTQMSLGNFPTKQDPPARRFVTCEGYSYRRRKEELQGIEQKMRQLKEGYSQLFCS